MWREIELYGLGDAESWKKHRFFPSRSRGSMSLSLQAKTFAHSTVQAWGTPLTLDDKNNSEKSTKNDKEYFIYE